MAAFGDWIDNGSFGSFLGGDCDWIENESFGAFNLRPNSVDLGD